MLSLQTRCRCCFGQRVGRTCKEKTMLNGVFLQISLYSRTGFTVDFNYWEGDWKTVISARRKNRESRSNSGLCAGK